MVDDSRSARNMTVDARDARQLKPPPFQPVQLATLVDTVPTGDRWLHEMKYDGYRTAGRGRRRRGARLHPLGARLVATSSPGSSPRRRELHVRVGADRRRGGRASTQTAGRASRRCRARSRARRRRIDYFAFDLLELDGEDLTGLPLIERKERLRAILPEGSDAHPLFRAYRRQWREAARTASATPASKASSRSGPTAAMSARARAAGSRPSASSARSSSIVGWTPSDKSRLFRSLMLGVHEDGELRYAGKVGTGFDNDEIVPPDGDDGAARAEGADGRRRRAPRCAARIGSSRKLVAEIAYTEMTNEGTLRHPSYLGLREDKKPEAVVLEIEAAGRRGRGDRRVDGQDQQPRPGDLSRERHHQGPARRLLRGGRADHAALGRQPADQPGPLPAGPGQEVLLPEARRRQLRRHGPACRHPGEGRARGALSLSSTRRRAADLRPDGDDRVPRLGRADRGRREGRPAGVRPRSRRGARFRGGAQRPRSTSATS